MADSHINPEQKSELIETMRGDIKSGYEKICSSKRRKAVEIQSGLREYIGDFLRKEEFTEISPVILSPVTDPLDSSQEDGIIDYYGQDYRLTQSMIFHKQMALLSLDKIFIFSPNVRLENPEESCSDRHLAEFTQIDLEVRGATREEIMDIGERMIVYALKRVKKDYKKELKEFGRKIDIPELPFDKIKFKKAREEYGEDFEEALSKDHEEPFWLIDFPIDKREFYDKEYPNRKGFLKDMDLIYPNGYGEGISGGEREHKFDRLITRINKANLDPKQFERYLAMARIGIPPSAGFGMGIERLTRFVCGLDEIEKVTLFPKVPGKFGF